jgi:ATP:corrinoid adenosyltransferase
MPILVPVNPSFANDAEKEVWQALNRTLPDECWLLHGVRITNELGDREGDVIVMWPQKGVAFIEVKGGYITPQANGKFLQGSGASRHEIDPIDQAHAAMYQIRNWVLSQTSLGHWYTSISMAAFPNSTLERTYESPRAKRSQFIDRDDLDNPADLVRKSLDSHSGHALAPDQEDLERIAQALEANILDVTDPSSLALLIDSRTELVNEMAKENLKLLDFVEEINRFDVRGAAGTGKTSLAMEQARRLKGKGQRVLFLCYSRGLAASIRHDVETWEKSQRIDVVRTFHSLAIDWGVKIPKSADDAFWEKEAAIEFANLAQEAPIQEKFDAVIVDEAQDFDDSWWVTAEALLIDPALGGIYTFGDSGQGIFGRDGTKNLGFVPLRLKTNLRNSKPISDAANSFTETPAESLGLPGPKIGFIEMPPGTTKKDLIYAADDMVEKLRNEFGPQHIALLTTKSRHPMHKDQIKRDSDAYWRTIWDKQEIFYGTVSGFKGLERNCVILAINGFHDGVDPKELLYVGMTRARDYLVIIAKRSELESALDSELISTLENHVIRIESDL